MPGYIFDSHQVLILIIPIVQSIMYPLRVPVWYEIVTCVSAALGEELVFRAVLPGYLRNALRLSPVRSACIGSALFAVLHLSALGSGTAVSVVLLQVLYAFCAGLGFSGLTERQSSILPAVILHILIDLTAPAETEITPVLLITLPGFSLLFLLCGFLEYRKMKGMFPK